jgi:hypothetical protein
MNGQVVALMQTQLAPHASSFLYVSKDMGELARASQQNAVGALLSLKTVRRVP